MTFPVAGGISGVTLTNVGSGYTAPPTITIAPPANCVNVALPDMINPAPTCRQATASPVFSASVGSVNVTTGSAAGPAGLYTTAPTVGFTGGSGTGAIGTAVLSTSGGVKTVAMGVGSNGTTAGLYTVAPTVGFTGGAGTGASATSALAATGGVKTIALTNGGSGYTTVPTVTITGGAGATATAVLSAPVNVTMVTGVTIVNQGRYFGTTPTVTFSAPPAGGIRATGTAVMTGTTFNRRVTGVTMTNRGSGYTVAPTITFSAGSIRATGTATIGTVSSSSVSGITLTSSGTGFANTPVVSITGGNGAGATATATLGNPVGSVTLVNSGTGYTSNPTVTFTGGSGAGATATAIRGFGVASVTINNGGSGFTSAPAVSFTGGGGSGAIANAVLGASILQSVIVTDVGNGYLPGSTPPLVVFSAPSAGVTATGTVQLPIITATPFSYKAVIEGFTFDKGTMNAQLGSGFPAIGQNLNAVAAVPFGYVDPTSDSFRDGETQLWRFSHIGIDVHYIHFHLFNVQIINRIGIDGSMRDINANELGWKETVRMNPFEDIVLAIKPIKPSVPWELPNSIRLMDVTTPAGSVNGPANCQANPLAPPGIVLPNCLPFSISDPAGGAVAITNSPINYGWEYVFHCHILGHEENDMMRPMSLAIAPSTAPLLASVVITGNGNKQRAVVTWSDTTITETAFTIQQAASVNGPWINSTPRGTGTNPVNSTTGPTIIVGKTFTTANLARGSTFFFRVIANNVVGCSDLVCSNPFTGWNNTQADSPASSVLSVTTN